MFATLAILPIATTLSVAIADAVSKWLDRRIPDDLPQTAGAWIQQQIERLGYHWLRVIVTEHSRSWFAPKSKVIHLAADTYYKRDPLYWAVAAHELGHARFAFRHPVAARLINAMGVMSKFLATFGFGLAFGNVMVAVPMIDHLAFACLVVALALRAAILVEEAIASVFACAFVRDTGLVTPGPMRAVALSLALAWNTYFTHILGYAAMLSRWSVLGRAIGGGWTPSGGVTPIGYGVAGIATVVFVVALYVRYRGGRRLLLERTIANIAIVWLMWDCGHPWLAALAVVPFGTVLAWLASLPALALVMPLERLLRNLTGVHKTDELAHDRSRGGEAIKMGNRVLEALMTRDRKVLSLPERLAELDALLVLPLVILFWLTS